MSLAAQLLRKHRELLKLSKSEMARQLSVTVQFIYNVEAGVSNVPKDRLIKWCELIKLDRKLLAKAMTADFSVKIQDILAVNEGKRVPTVQPAEVSA